MYREAIHFDPPVLNQMELACTLLHEWVKYDAVITGGALWSWAANSLARDIDIFAKNGWFKGAEKKAQSLIKISSDSIIMGKEVYGMYDKRWKPVKNIQVFKGTIEEVPFDLVLTKFKEIKALDFFDYSHCKVCFSPKEVSLHGVVSYMEGKLHKTGSMAREEELIKKKIQRSLWGNPEAESAITRVMVQLNNIYNKLEE